MFLSREGVVARVARVVLFACLIALAACQQDPEPAVEQPAEQVGLCADHGIVLTCLCPGGVVGRLVCDEAGQAAGCECPNPDDPDMPGQVIVGEPDLGPVIPAEPRVVFNACGGRGELVFGGEAAEPGGECGDPVCPGKLVCQGTDALECVGARTPNACGGCGLLSRSVGDACGECDSGTWQCDPQSVDRLVCEGSTGRNACQGCGVLEQEPNQVCQTDDGVIGISRCVNLDATRCVGPDSNACGGTEPLELGAPLDSCGVCEQGFYICAGLEALKCVEEERGVNACGGCEQLNAEPGTSCSDCARGRWECVSDDPNRVECSAPVNLCGGCESLSAAPGEACGDDMVQVCETVDTVACVSNADRHTNGCGGDNVLTDPPGEACGVCGGGQYVCLSPHDTTCVDDGVTNPCGGCSTLPGIPGTSCGFNSLWRCVTGDLDALECEFVGPTNICGGEQRLENQPGDPCGACGAFECDGADALACAGSVDLMSDERHCGACDNACAHGEYCFAGVCEAPGVAAVTGGTYHACALFNTGEVSCWGGNEDGRLGDGTMLDSTTPVRVAGLIDAVQIGAGLDYTCARRVNGEVVCWGANDVGQLGLGSFSPTSLVSPNTITGQVVGVTNAIDLAVGMHSACVIDEVNAGDGHGVVKCWGRPGELRRSPDYVDAALDFVSGVGDVGPSAVPGIDDAIKVDVGNRLACAVLDADSFGEVKCWGEGALGNQNVYSLEEAAAAPVTVIGLNNIIDVKVSDSHAYSHVCALRDERAGAPNELWCWGDNSHEQLGLQLNVGLTPSLGKPRRTGITGVASFEVGYRGTCAIFEQTLDAKCWGDLGYTGISSAMDTADLTSLRSADRGGEALQGGRFKSIHLGPDHHFHRQAGVSGGFDESIWSPGVHCFVYEPPGVGQFQVRCAGNNLHGGVGDDQILNGLERDRPVPVVNLSPVTHELGRCRDLLDNDGDGLTDCEDPDCVMDVGQATGPGAIRVQLSEWGKYETPSCGASLAFKSATARLLWTAPAVGRYSFARGGSADAAVFAMDLHRGACSAAPDSCARADEVGYAPQEISLAAGEQVYLVVQASSESYADYITEVIELDVEVVP